MGASSSRRAAARIPGSAPACWPTPRHVHALGDLVRRATVDRRRGRRRRRRHDFAARPRTTIPVRGILDGLEERARRGADEDPLVVMAQAVVALPRATGSTRSRTSRTRSSTLAAARSSTATRPRPSRRGSRQRRRRLPAADLASRSRAPTPPRSWCCSAACRAALAGRRRGAEVDTWRARRAAVAESRPRAAVGARSAALEHGGSPPGQRLGRRTPARQRRRRRQLERGRVEPRPSRTGSATATSSPRRNATASGPGVERRVGAGERGRPARAQREQLADQPQLARVRPVRRGAVAQRAEQPRRRAQSTGRRLSGSTSDERDQLVALVDVGHARARSA